MEAQVKQIELQVATEVTNAAINLRNTAESVQAAQAARELSLRRLEAEQSKFEVGMSTNFAGRAGTARPERCAAAELRPSSIIRRARVEFERLRQTTLQQTEHHDRQALAAAQGGGGQ